MNTLEVIGLVAAFLTTVSFLPQAVKVISTKDTKSISLRMYLMFIMGVALWFYYGWEKDSIPMILGNGITLFLAGIILFYKLREK
ncbi:MAG: MtN3 and saliva related transmembrane protein [Algoriphagus sp.]|jgi:MtN3 and saliva related transmembrane protein